MANCKICGQPVMAGPVMHSECLTQTISEAATQFCDNYCFRRIECISEEKLHEMFCGNCPAKQLMELTKRGGQS